MLRILLSVVCTALFLVGIARYILAHRKAKSRITQLGERSQQQSVIAFFHPYWLVIALFMMLLRVEPK